jgi:thiosulfate/3-mercaptopyruvate sulfurtransferase
VPGRESFLEFHIPGGVFLDLNTLRDLARPAHVVDAEGFGDVMSRLGVGSDDGVVVYDTDGGVWSGRLWWALRLYGHKSVRILDGGFTNWVQQRLPVASGETMIESSRFVATPRPEFKVDIGDVVAAMSDPGISTVVAVFRGLSAPHTGTATLGTRY